MNRRLLILAMLAACLNCLPCDVASAAGGAATQAARSADGPADAPMRPPAPPLHSQLDSELIRHGADGGGASSSPAPHPQSIELPRVAGALAIVIALILLRWGGKKLFASGTPGRSTRAVQVLARSCISPRQHIVLLRIGQRVIVVGDSGAQMNPLSEITDPDEIASLLGQLQDEKSRLPAKAFSALFSRARAEMDGDDDEAPGNASLQNESHNEMSDEAGGEPPVDPAISVTRDEITGLMDKIRVLSKHFRGGQA